MMLTMTPRNIIAARTAYSGRVASDVVRSVVGIFDGGIVVILGDSLRSSVSNSGISYKIAERTQKDARGNNKTDHYDATATDTSKPRRRTDDHPGNGGRHHHAQTTSVWQGDGTA